MISFDKLNFFDNESENDGSGSGSPGTFDFPFLSGISVGSADEFIVSVSGVGSGNFVLIEIESVGDFVQLVIFLPREVDSKGGRLIGAESKGGPHI